MKKFLVILAVVVIYGCDLAPKKEEKQTPQVVPQYLNLREVWRLEGVNKVLSYEPKYENIYARIGYKIACVDKADGNVKWRVPFYYEQFEDQIGQWGNFVVHYYDPHFSHAILNIYKAENGASLYSLEAKNNAKLFVEDGRAYLYFYRFLYAYDIPSGKSVWKNDFNTQLGVGDKLLYFDAMDKNIFVGNSNTQRGYDLVINLDFFSGLQKWSSLGRLLRVDENNAYILKAQTNEIWARNTQTGEYIYSYKPDNFTDDEFWTKNGDLIYTSMQKYNDSERAIIEAKNDLSGYTAQTGKKFVARELIRVNPKENKVKWFITLGKWSNVVRFENIIVESNDGRLKAYDIRYGNPIWELSTPEGIKSFSVSNDMLFVNTGAGELIAYKF